MLSCVIWQNLKSSHLPRTVARPVTCLGDRWQTYHVSSQRRDTVPSRTPATERHAAVVCRPCCIPADQAKTVTSPADVVTSPKACRQKICRLLTQSAATSLGPSDHQLTLARCSSHCRRRTVDDHRGRRRCLGDLSFLWHGWLPVNGMCRRWTSQRRGTQRWQCTRCYPVVSLRVPSLQQIAYGPL